MRQKDLTAKRKAGFTDRLLQLLGGTRVFALIGKSGTGKSFRAKLVAERYHIDYIIDDGLLIHDNSIIAGKSAKREKYYMAAVRTALFDDPAHQQEVIKAIRNRKVKKILLIGTSERMVTRAAKRLNLPPISRLIKIEEIASKEEIEQAQRSRNDEGKHVIPVPTIEVERDYPGFLSDSIKVLFKFGIGKLKHTRVYEKSVVQPSFHEMDKGKVAISEQALGQMIAHCVDEFDDKLTVKKLKFRQARGAFKIRAELEAPFGHGLSHNLHDLQNYIVGRIEKFTGIIIEEFNLVIAGIAKPKKFDDDETIETPLITHED